MSTDLCTTFLLAEISINISVIHLQYAEIDGRQLLLYVHSSVSVKMLETVI
jgi:hypothetical protein